MRTKNAKPITDRERAYLADLKLCGCVFCDSPKFAGWAGGFATEAHHPTGCQGLHWNAISACIGCHNARVWNFGAMNELEAMNETRRRVDEYRETGAVTIRPHTSRQNSTRTPSKVIPRRVA